MSFLKQTFDGDTSRIEAAYGRIQRDNAKLIAQNQQLARQSARSQRSFSSGMHSGARQIQNMATQYITLTAGVDMVTRAYAGWREEMQNLGDEHTKFAAKAIRAITETGDLASSKKIRGRLETMPGATAEQALAAFSGVSAGVPEADLERRLKLARRVARQAPTGVDLEQVGELAGEMAKRMPGKKAGDIVDLATKLRAEAGGNIQKVATGQFWKAVGILQDTGAATPEQAMGITLEGMKKGMRAEAVITAAAKIEDFKPSKTDPLHKTFAAAGPKDRLEMLLSDKAMATSILGDQGVRLSQIDRGEAMRLAGAFGQAQREDFAFQQVRNLKESVWGQEALREHQTALKLDRSTRAAGLREAQTQRAIDIVKAETQDEGWWAQAHAQRFAKADRWLGASAKQILEATMHRGYLGEGQVKQFVGQEAEITNEIQRQTDILKGVTEEVGRKLEGAAAAAEVGRHLEN